MQNVAVLIFIALLSISGCQKPDKKLEIETNRVSELIKKQFTRQSTIIQAENFILSQNLEFTYLDHEECLSGIGSNQVCTDGGVLQGIKTLNQGALGARSHIIVRLYFHKSGDYAWYQVNTAHTFL